MGTKLVRITNAYPHMDQDSEPSLHGCTNRPQYKKPPIKQQSRSASLNNHLL